jgi:hypothetical protein
MLTSTCKGRRKIRARCARQPSSTTYDCAFHSTNLLTAKHLTTYDRKHFTIDATTSAMLALRDQENLVHARQTTAAGKPLNQGIRALHPKTPGNLKTPFRPAKNDENATLAFKGQQGLVKDGPSKLDKNAFATPLGKARPTCSRY